MRHAILLAALFSASLAAEKQKNARSAEGLLIPPNISTYFDLGPRGPKKNYRARLAKQYFGGGSRCHSWNRFCR